MGAANSLHCHTKAVENQRGHNAWYKECSQCEWWIFKTFVHLTFGNESSYFQTCCHWKIGSSHYFSKWNQIHLFSWLLAPPCKSEDTLEGHLVDVQVRTTKVDGETYFWPDSSSKDYIHCTSCLQVRCSYVVAMHYKKVKSKNAIKESFDIPSHKTCSDSSQDDLSVAPDDEMANSTSAVNTFEFMATHPVNRCTKLSKLKNWVVPIMYYNGACLCSICKLHICDKV